MYRPCDFRTCNMETCTDEACKLELMEAMPSEHYPEADDNHEEVLEC